MLKELIVKNIVLIELIKIEFKKGLSVLNEFISKNAL